jgi:Protein of unknown function (DUF1428)
MNNKITTESATEIEEEETESYLQISFSRAPKKNHDALVQLGKRWVQWLKKQGVKSEIYYLNNNSGAENVEVYPGLESIAKILSISEDEEELGVSLQFYRDKAHADQVRSKMMQDETASTIGMEFEGLVSQGKSLITDGFNKLV